MPMSSPNALDEAARLLETGPHSVLAHVLMGDHYAAARDEQQAIYYYGRALALAEVQDLADADVERAGAVLAKFQARAAERREARLTSRGVLAGERSPRLAEALDLAAGRRRLYREEPTAFTYPGLPAIQFFDPAEFAWTEEVEAAAPAIRAEFETLLQAGTDEFRAYVQHQTVAPEANKALL